MSSKNLVFLVKCREVAGDDWMQVIAKNRYEAAEDYARVVDQETDVELGGWFSRQLKPVSIQVKDPQDNTFDMQITAQLEVNYSIADMEKK